MGILLDWYRYWNKFLKGVPSDSTYELVRDDTPIYDQLEREWARQGKFHV